MKEKEGGGGEAGGGGGGGEEGEGKQSWNLIFYQKKNIFKRKKTR